MPLLLLLGLLPSVSGLRRRDVKVDLVTVADSLQPDWVPPLLRKSPDTRLRLYCTGKAPLDAPCTASRGRSERIFLKHIVENYDELAPVTIFAPKDVQAKGYKLEYVEDLAKDLRKGRDASFLARPFHPIGPAYDGPQEACGPSVRPFGKWYQRFVNASDGGWQHIGCTAAALGNVFAVSAERIQRQPLETYKGMLAEMERCDKSLTTAYFVERSWAALFSEKCHDEEGRAYLQARASGTEAVMLHRPAPKTTIDLVVASYNAPLAWIEDQLQKLPGARLRLYCKGPVKDPRCIRMENVGTEEYAYLTHMVKHYDDLADITIFSKDNMLDTGFYKPTMLETLNLITDQLADTNVRNSFSGYLAHNWYPLGPNWDLFKYHASSTDNKIKYLCRPSVSPFGPWYKRFVNPEDTNLSHLQCTAVSMHGIFAVSRDRIRRIPKARFEEIIKEVERCRGNNAFTAGHYLERSWAPLFAERCHQEEAEAALRKATHLQQWYKQFENVTEG